jgi:hypothetical protein
MMIGGGGKLPVCRAGSYATILYVNIRGDKQVGGLRRRLPAVDVFGINTNGLKSTGCYSYSGGCDQTGWAR